MDLKLPEIEPARVVPSAANAIDRAGAQFKQGAESVGQALLAPEMAKLQVESQEATIQRSREEKDKLDFIKRNPYVTVETAKGMFLGGEMPAGVRLTEPDGSPRLIPMSELAVAYFDQEAPGVTERAAAHISAPGWRQRFKLAAQEDSNQKRAEVVELQRNLQLADNELRTKFQYEQAMAARDFPLAETILASDLALGEVERTKMRAEHPAKKTMAVVLDRLRSRDVAELDSLISDLKANEVNPERGIFEPIGAEKRYLLLERARDAKANLLAEQERAAKAAEEQEFLGIVGKAHAAALEAGKQNAPGTAAMSLDEIPIVMSNGRPMSPERYETVKRILTADPARGTDMRYYGVLSRVVRAGQLPQLSYDDLSKLTQHLSASEERAWMDKWSQARKDPESVKPPLPAHYYAAIRDGVKRFMGSDYKEDSPRALELEATLERALVGRVDEGLKKDDIFSMVVDLANGKKGGMFSSKIPAAASGEIRRQVGRANTAGNTRISLTDSYVADVWKKVEETRDDVQTEWERAGGEGDIPDATLVRVYYKLNDPKKVEQLRAAVAAKTKGPVTDLKIRYEAVLEDMGAEAERPRAERTADAEKKATENQLTNRRERIRREARRLLDDTKNRPPELEAEFSRLADLIGRPKPGTSYNYTAADYREMQEQAAFDYAEKLDAASHIRKAH